MGQIIERKRFQRTEEGFYLSLNTWRKFEISLSFFWSDHLLCFPAHLFVSSIDMDGIVSFFAEAGKIDSILTILFPACLHPIITQYYHPTLAILVPIHQRDLTKSIPIEVVPTCPYYYDFEALKIFIESFPFRHHPSLTFIFMDYTFYSLWNFVQCCIRCTEENKCYGQIVGSKTFPTLKPSIFKDIESGMELWNFCQTRSILNVLEKLGIQFHYIPARLFQEKWRVVKGLENCEKSYSYFFQHPDLYFNFVLKIRSIHERCVVGKSFLSADVALQDKKVHNSYKVYVNDAGQYETRLFRLNSTNLGQFHFHSDISLEPYTNYTNDREDENAESSVVSRSIDLSSGKSIDDRLLALWTSSCCLKKTSTLKSLWYTVQDTEARKSIDRLCSSLWQ